MMGLFFAGTFDYNDIIQVRRLRLKIQIPENLPACLKLLQKAPFCAENIDYTICTFGNTLYFCQT